jgi:predicted PurR-regulated permease PerM
MSFEQFLYDYDIIDADETIQGAIDAQLKSAIGIATFTNIFKNFISATGSFFFGTFSVLFLTFFFLRSENMFSNFILLLVPSPLEEEVKHIISKTHNLLSRYLMGLLAELTCMITLLSVGLYILGVKNALIIGFLGGLMNIVPYLGPLIGGAMGVIIAITTALSFEMYDAIMLIGIEVIAVFLVANLIDNLVLQPFIYSNVAKAHPVEIFLVIIMAGSLAGIPGMILAIPGYTVIRIIAKEFLSNVKLVKKLTEKI